MYAPAVDHVTVAGRDLKALDTAFAAAGLAPEYGGAHSNGVTHMSVIAFPDGSYLELVSTLRAGDPSPLWTRHMETAGSPSAWCVSSDDLAGELERMTQHGVEVRGPMPYSRERADGSKLEWDLGFLDEGEPGAVLPFLIQDRTDRALRVPASERIAGSGLGGVAAVVIGCHGARECAKKFTKAYGWADPASAPMVDDGSLGIRLLRLPGKPLVFAEPAEQGNWLSQRLEKFGEAPCAFLFRSDYWSNTESRIRFSSHSSWFGERVSWLCLPDLPETRIGVVKA